VGIFALRSLLLGRGDVEIDTLFVRPEARRRGVANRAIDGAYAAAVLAGGSGIRIPTSWCWQNAVKFYINRGLWVANWKHSLVFSRHHDLGTYRVERDGTMARFEVQANGLCTPVLQAKNCGPFLQLTELSSSGVSEIQLHHAYGTFALHLAMEGWPLVRSEELWEKRYHHSDMGMPEGLAYKIGVFESEARQKGYDVKTPRIAGLDYGAVAVG
jgi:hypothetical protein